MANHDLIKCSDHRLAPWSIVCTHLMTGQSKEWKPIHSNNPEVDNDWLCPECHQTHMHALDHNLEEDLTHLRAVCIHCVHKLRTMHDQNYNPDEP